MVAYFSSTKVYHNPQGDTWDTNGITGAAKAASIVKFVSGSTSPLFCFLLYMYLRSNTIDSTIGPLH